MRDRHSSSFVPGRIPKKNKKKSRDAPLHNHKDENPTEKGNMRDVATLNQLLVLANLESYNAVLINQGKSQKERMELLRQLAVQQLQTLETVSLNNLPKFAISRHEE